MLMSHFRSRRVSLIQNTLRELLLQLFASRKCCIWFPRMIKKNCGRTHLQLCSAEAARSMTVWFRCSPSEACKLRSKQFRNPCASSLMLSSIWAVASFHSSKDFTSEPGCVSSDWMLASLEYAAQAHWSMPRFLCQATTS